jgi:hypothetical protein
MSGPVSAAIAAEAVVVLAIFIMAATYVNAEAIFNAVAAWGTW